MYNQDSDKLGGKPESALSIVRAKICWNYPTKKESDGNESIGVVNGPKTDYKSFYVRNFTTDTGQGERHQQQPDSERTAGGQFFKDIVISNDKKEGASSLASHPEPSDNYVHYNRILVPHDGSDASDTALSHAIYLSKMSDAEIIILHVVEKMHDMNSSAVTAMSKEQSSQAKHDEVSNANEEFDIRVEGEVKHMIEEKIGLCKNAGVKSQVSYKVQTGKPVEEIVKSAEHMN